MKEFSLFLALVISFVNACAFRIEYGRNVLIHDPVFENLYIAGGSVTINAPVHGDLIIIGGNIIINDTITNDIIVAGGTVDINGFVAGDIRCAGGNVHISRSVSGDVVIAGGSVNVDNGISIGNLLASGGDITIDGDVVGEIRGAFGSLDLNGFVGKNIDCRGGRLTINGIINGSSVLAAREIIIGHKAQFHSPVRYWNKSGKLNFQQAIKNVNATYDPSLKVSTGEWYYLGAETMLLLLWYLGMAFLMVVLVEYLFAATMKKAADTVYNKTLSSLGFGILFFIAFPIAAVVALVTIVGIPLGLLMIFIYITLALLATVITSVVVANWYNNRYEKSWNFWRIAFAAFGVFIIFKLVFLLPFVGWLVMSLAACISFGGILLNIKWKHTRNEAAVNQNIL